MRILLRVCAIALLTVAASCSTTRSLQEGQYRLDSHSVEISGDESSSLTPADLTGYIRQKPNSSFLGFKPFLYVYNWSGHDKGSLWRKLGEAPVIYDPAAADNSAYNIRRHLEYLGYYGSQVEPEVSYDGRLASVRYVVNPGRRIPIDSVRYILPEGFDEVFLADTLVKPGAFLSEAALDAGISREVSRLRRMGYYGVGNSSFRFTADTISTPGKLILDCELRPSSSDGRMHVFTVGKVDIRHPESMKIRPSVLGRLNLIRPGLTYDEQTVSDTYSRLSSVKLFSKVAVEMNQRGEDTVDCQITLRPSRLKGFKANFEASSNSSGLMGVSPQLSFYHKNVFHGGEFLTLGFTGNFQFKFADDTHSEEFGASMGLSIPGFAGFDSVGAAGATIPRTEVSLSYNYQSRPEYTRNVLSGAFGYSGIHGRRLRYSLYPLQLSFVHLYGLDEGFSARLDKNPYMKYSYQDHFDAGVGGTLYYSSSTEVIPKGAYDFVRLQFDLSGLIVSAFSPLMQTNSLGEKMVLGSPFSQYARYEVQFGRCIRFGEDGGQALAFRLLQGFGAAYGNSSTMPYEKQFYCGGASGMRGWQTRALGPGSAELDGTFSIPSQTGDFKLEADVEWRFPVSGVFEGALFAEAGNVWNIREEGWSLLHSIAADWGIGVRLNLDFILVRLDWGIRLRDPSLESSGGFLSPWKAIGTGGSAIHFGVGYPF